MTPIRLTRRTLHRYAGTVLAIFVLVHLLNHLFVLSGAAAHIAVMDGLRRVYRWPGAEVLLLLCVLVQLGTGPWLDRTGGGPMPSLRRWARLSGVYLLFFLLIHIGAVLTARWIGRDTNIFFAAAGMHAWPLALFFYPYYFLAVVTACLHLGNGLTRSLRGAAKQRVMAGAAIAGVVAGILILAGMARLTIPAEFRL